MKTSQKKILSLNLFFLCKNPLIYKIVGLKLEIQARNQNFFRAGEVSWNYGTSINIFSNNFGAFSPRYS